MKVSSLIILAIFVFSIFSCRSSKIKVESSGTDDLLIFSNEDTDDVAMFSDVEVKPMFNGKDADVGFLEYIIQNIRYPVEAMERKITGIVVVEFVITKDGSIDRVKVVKSAHRLLDAEALRVIKNSPNWSPGLQCGEKVNVKYSFPVRFRMN